MSIIITNDGSNPRSHGDHKYTIRINQQVITQFVHRRQEGLAACLRKAADAVEATEVIKPVVPPLVDHKTRFTRACGGCGETNPHRQCLNCRHEF